MPEDGIYRAILIVLVISVMAGVAAVLAGSYLFHSTAMEQAGTGLTLICGALYFVFRWLGRREMRRRGRAGPGQDERDHSDK